MPRDKWSRMSNRKRAECRTIRWNVKGTKIIKKIRGCEDKMKDRSIEQ